MLLPKELVSSHLKLLGTRDFSVLLALWYLHHSYSTPCPWITDERLSNDFGFSKKNLQRSRKRLKENGFIDYKIGYRIGNHARATRYLLVPDAKIRASFRIPDEPKWLPARQGHRKPNRPP